MQLLLFGYAINMDVRMLPAAVADLSASAASRQYVQDLAHSQVIEIRYQAGSAAELEALLRAGQDQRRAFPAGRFRAPAAATASARRATAD